MNDVEKAKTISIIKLFLTSEEVDRFEEIVGCIDSKGLLKLLRLFAKRELSDNVDNTPVSPVDAATVELVRKQFRR